MEINKNDTDLLETEILKVLDEFFQKVKNEKGKILVVGCSSSEIIGKTIGQFSSEEVGEKVFSTIYKYLKEKNIYIACQACEHLNRALVVEKKLAIRDNLEIVSAVPHAKAGGSFATAAYKGLEDPVLVEFIKADYGLDIGDTFIGMHMKHVCVPVRVSTNKIGQAHITLCYQRPKLIGGNRARYE